MKPIELKYAYPYAPDLNVTTFIYPLTKEGIMIIPEDIEHGNYRIGIRSTLFGHFHVKYIGRADDGLRPRMRQHLNDKIKKLIDDNPGNVFFDFNEQNNELDSYHRECRDFHDFDPDLNENHPAKPGQTCTQCKICGK